MLFNVGPNLWFLADVPTVVNELLQRLAYISCVTTQPYSNWINAWVATGQKGTAVLMDCLTALLTKPKTPIFTV